MCNLLRSKRLKWTHALIFFVIVAAASSPSIAADDPDSIQAEQKLRGYFEFPRKPLEECDCEGLSGANRVLKATSRFPGLIFTSRRNLEHDPPVCGDYPAILASSGTKWWSIEFELYSWSWSDIRTTPDRSKIWAVLDYNCGDPGNTTLVLFSRDGGWTWITLSAVEHYYQDFYETLRMAPDGQGVMVVGWDCETTRSCPVCKNSDTAACRGLDFYRTHDWGATWDAPVSEHGCYRPIGERGDSEGRPLVECRHFEYHPFEEFRSSFPATPVEINSRLLPGAVSLPFDEGLLRRAKSLVWWGAPFLEATDSEPAGLQYPYILEWGSEHEKTLPLVIKLPYAGYRWRAYDGGSVGILQLPNKVTGETWVLHRVNKERHWTAGRLTDLPSEPYSFDSMIETKDGELELHLRRLVNEADGREPGREVYRSTDGGRSWAKARLEPDILMPVDYYRPAAKSDDLEKEIRKAMDECLAEIRQLNLERPAPPLKSPAIAELVALFLKTDWRMPCFGHELLESRDMLDGQPALHFALTYEGGSIDLLKALLEGGADATAREFYGDTALDLAVSMNHQEAVRLLRAQNAPWGGANEDGFTSLLWLASTLDPDATYWKGSREEVTKRALEHAEFLLEHGADVNAKGRTEGRVLEEALEHKAPPEFVQLLIKHGALKDGEH